MSATASDRRILVIDDNRSIHIDFRKVLEADRGLFCAAQRSEAELFGEPVAAHDRPGFRVDCATQGAEGVERVRDAVRAQRPYSVAFVDARMPPGIDGLKTIAGIWEIDPDVQIVLCTAHADFTWQQIWTQLRNPRQMVYLKKPFDTLEVLQLAASLTHKWELVRRERQLLEQPLADRKREAQAVQKLGIPPEGGPARAQGASDKRRRLLERLLGNALDGDELTLHFQPLVEIASRRINALEALLRWRSAELGNVSPAEFIPIAEATGMILPIGEFVFRQACAQMARWQHAGIPAVPMAVNVSAVQIDRQPLRELVLDSLRDTGLRPEHLVIELTESTLMKDAQRHIHALQRLRNEGVGIAIDDFGTGYSSLSYLRDLPIDTLKIDRSFVRHIDSSPPDEAIVDAVLGMSRALHLEVVAEGVETFAQLEVLARHGCSIAQGVYFSRPLPESECRELLIQLARRSSFTDTLRLSAGAARRDKEQA